MSNFAKIQSAMNKAGLPALLLTDELDRRYASGFHATDGVVLIFPDSACCVTDSRYIEAARQAVRDAEVIESTAQRGETKILIDLLKEHGVTELGAQEESLSYGRYLRVEKALGVKLIPAGHITAALRQCKDESEIKRITAAQRIAEAALDRVLPLIRAGMTEKQIAAELNYAMALLGAEGLAFDTICVAGKNSSKPHGVPSDYAVKKGDFITMDFGCRVDGYCSDMTRTVALGSVTDEMRKVYDTVLAAQTAGIAAAAAGVTGRVVDAAAREVIDAAGYGKCFGHSFGHSLGLSVHEPPNAAPSNQRPLPAGAVITAEPGIYLEGRFGVRIEDMLLLTEKGAENLTLAPKKLIIL